MSVFFLLNDNEPSGLSPVCESPCIFFPDFQDFEIP